jgi:hypothetical protein
VQKKRGGRPKGTTKRAAAKTCKKMKESITKAALLYEKAKEEARKEGKLAVSKGVLEKIVSDVETEAGLSANTISLDTIRSRIKRGNAKGINCYAISPIADLEPLIVEFCIRLAKIGNPLTKKTVTLLANDLVTDNEYESRIINCKKDRHLVSDGTLGDAWYRGFMTRHKEVLTNKQRTVKDVKRNTWVTVENFESMYENVYEAMVEAGIAEKKEEAVQYETGRPSQYVLTKPEYLLFVDETGCNTNQLDDGHVGGETFILPKDDPEAAPRGSTTDIHFTVLAFVSGTGVPVMCTVIFKSELPVSEIPVSWKLGLDITADVDDADKVMKGGPCCNYRGKIVPCFYCTSPKASITSSLLADMLGFIDECGIFDRSIAKPFLLLDGHGSRMMLPFLKYINHPEHEWVCCIGVPYATHIWQVGDASALNGAFKIALAKAKREYLKYRSNPRFEPTDIVPLLNQAWEKSFNSSVDVRAAIAHRGWNPLNYNLLDHLNHVSQQPVLDLTATDAPSDAPSDEYLMPPPLPRPNITAGVGSYYMDLIIEEERKSEGRKQKFIKLKSEVKTREEKVEHFKKLTKISSSVLAANNHYVLDRMILNQVQEKHDMDEAAKQVAEQKRNEKKRSADEKFYKVAEKFVSGAQLSVDDMRCLLLRVKSRTDSPLRTKKADVERQYNDRKHRIEEVISAMRISLV